MNYDNNGTVIKPLSDSTVLFGEKVYMIKDLSNTLLVVLRSILIDVLDGNKDIRKKLSVKYNVLVSLEIPKVREKSPAFFIRLRKAISNLVSEWWIIVKDNDRERLPIAGSDENAKSKATLQVGKPSKDTLLGKLRSLQRELENCKQRIDDPY